MPRDARLTPRITVPPRAVFPKPHARTVKSWQGKAERQWCPCDIELSTPTSSCTLTMAEHSLSQKALRHEGLEALISFIGDDQFGMKDQRGKTSLICWLDLGQRWKEVHFRIYWVFTKSCVKSCPRHLSRWANTFQICILSDFTWCTLMVLVQVCPWNPLLLSFPTSIKSKSDYRNGWAACRVVRMQGWACVQEWGGGPGSGLQGLWSLKAEAGFGLAGGEGWKEQCWKMGRMWCCRM